MWTHLDVLLPEMTVAMERLIPWLPEAQRERATEDNMTEREGERKSHDESEEKRISDDPVIN